MNKVRIVKRTNVDGVITYIIQQKHFIFRWWWVDAWVNNVVDTKCEFSSLEELENHLCYFDGSKTKQEILITFKQQEQ
jgi:hypothetical protein